MTLDDVLFAASCAAPFVVAYGAARLWVDRRRIFRRDPPHLRDRVSVDCGAWETTLRMFDDFGPVGWTPPSDAVGRAFLKSAPPSALGRAVQKAQAAYSCGERVAWVTPEEYEAACYTAVGSQRFVPGFGNVLLLLGVRLEVLTPEDIERGRCKPSPVENARRYTSEEETW